MPKPEWPSSITGEDPRPTSVVLYRSHRGWRYAIYMDGVMDGWLTDIPVEAPAVEAQAAAIAFLEGGIERTLDVTWVPDERPDWWTGEVTACR